MTTIRVKTVPTNLKRGEKPVSRYIALHNGKVYSNTVYADASQKSGLPVPILKASWDMVVGGVVDNLRKGYRVEFPHMSAFLTLPGSVESPSAEMRRETPLKLVVRLSAKGELKTCCQGSDFVLENITRGATVVLDSVIDNISKTPGVLTNGTGVEVHVVGNGLYMPDLADPTVGAYIADSAGIVLVKGTVTEYTATTLVCAFSQIDLEPGTYRFCIASRNGLDPAQFGVTIGRRNVSVVNASTEGEEVANG